MKNLCVLPLLTAACLTFAAPPPNATTRPLELGAMQTVSPDGQTLAFVALGDLWTVPMAGGPATRITHHPAQERWPVFSPDGSRLAFTSDREGYHGLYVMPVTGGPVSQIGFHSEGYTPLQWTAEGILCENWRDHGGLIGRRLFLINADERRAEKMLFDAYGARGQISPDQSKVLFCREGNKIYRKGYQGSLASQIWLYDRASHTFTQPVQSPGGCRSPLWKPDGSGFWYLAQYKECFNLFEYDFKKGSSKRLTDYADHSIILPTAAADGSVIVYRQGFIFKAFYPGRKKAEALVDLPITIPAPGANAQIRRRWYEKMWNNDTWSYAAWTEDGLQTAFCAGGDLFTMDTVLKQPVLIAGRTDLHDKNPLFADDDNAILFIRDDGHHARIVRATRTEAHRPWWRNQEFTLETLLDHPGELSQLSLSPDGKHIAYCADQSTLMIADSDGKNPRVIQDNLLDTAYYSWAPNGKWVAAMLKDSADNWDVWILSTEGAREPYNLSRHVDYDGQVAWSPDGSRIAWVSLRGTDRKSQVQMAYLTKEAFDEAFDNHHLENALKKTPETDPPKPEESEQETDQPKKQRQAEPMPEDVQKQSSPPGKEPAAPAPDTDAELHGIAFAGLQQRVRALKINGENFRSPFWSYDSQVVAFNGTLGGKSGCWKIGTTEGATPAQLSSRQGWGATWLKKGSLIAWSYDGRPAHLNTSFTFKAYQETHLGEYRRLAFRMAWRLLRDQYYDARFNNKDWDALRERYEPLAYRAADWHAFYRVIYMLNGELNASHTGFTLSDKEWKPWSLTGGWSERTAHLGVWLDTKHTGEGWRVARPLTGAPADREPTLLSKDDIILSINGLPVDPEMDPTVALNGARERTLRLVVRNPHGKEREIDLPTITWDKARELVKEMWIQDNAQRVDAWSDGRFGYLHIDRMREENFERFQHEVLKQGYDKEAMVIDVRNNEGGYIADRLLTMLCRPIHAWTRPRDGHISYPRGYLPYGSWDKPVIVLCNQYTASNGEIFSHAIKTLKRGKVLGVQTQGAVISMPKEDVLDIGALSIPRRGWFVLGTGEDMEMNGARPDIEMWPRPGEIPAGLDTQLKRSVDELTKDLQKAPEAFKPRYASERDGKAPRE